ncbi:MAG: RluA family pseudouridine synthase [Clostridiales bacterium]|nr:RluA family pseudouridine synthase [Clostridiales bacterium]
MKIYHLIVPEGAAGTRAEVCIARGMPLLPAYVIREAFKRRDVKMNGRRIDKDAIAEEGAQIQVYTAFSPEIPIVYEDENILLIHKPAGLSCDEDGRGGMTALTLMQEHAGERYAPRLCHRLDHQTGGLLLFAKNDESEACLLQAFRDRMLKKVYQCLVRGEMRPAAAVKEAYLIKDADRAQVRVITHETPGARKIITEYETLSFDGQVSRLRITLHTGRTHQIRAHMSFLSHPLLGDDKYGDRGLNKRLKVNGLRLWATELTMQAGGCLAYLDGRKFTVEPPF